MPIEKQQRDGITIIEIEGEVTYDLSVQLAEILDGAIDAGEKTLLVVPRDVDVLNSMAIGTLFTRRSRLIEAGGAMAMAEVNERLSKTLRITRFDRLVDVYPDIPAAIEALKA